MKNTLDLIKDISIISNDELEKMTIDWNDTVHEIPENELIQTIFEQQVKLSPNAVALFFEGKSLSYEELNSKANQLAHFLRKQGVRRGQVVAFYLERSFKTVISILAILKAGGAFLPLDQSNPLQRTMFLLKDSKASCLITDSCFRKHLSDYHGRIIEIDQIQDELLSYPCINPEPLNSPTDLAYVIYTSGSTGNPKGVMIEHLSLINRLSWQQNEFNLTSNDRVLQKTPNNFDVSVWENLWPLLNGVELYILSPEVHKDPLELVKYIIKHRITTLHFVPSMLKEFLRTKDVEQCSSLKTVICSGESLSVNIQKTFFKKLKADLYNLYGPTEASIDVSYYKCKRDNSDLNSVPIGRPIWNTQLYILDNHLNPVPLGVEGELYIGGIGLARGYLNREELTTEKFIDNPFKTTHKKLYKTGDRARFFNDGNIEYLGRTDDQVKIRGNRIECGEIEYYLQKHPAIKDAVVICQDLEVQGLCLVAYIITGEKLVSSDIQTFLSQFIPDYMIPSYFNPVEKFPTTTNGKLDKSQLLKAKISTRSLNQQMSAPKTKLEYQLVSIWKSVLNINTVGVDDNFFHLGGHSLLATRIVAKIRKYLNTDISLREFFEAKTIEKLAEIIVCRAKSIQKISKIDREKNIPLSFAQQRLWFMEQLVPGTSIYNLPIFVRLSGKLCKHSIIKAYNALIQRHEVLRTVIEVDYKNNLYQKIQKSNNYQLEEISVDNITHAYQILQEEAEQPFQLNGGSLIRAKLLEIASSDNMLLITMHHLISDAWSMQVFFTELSIYYKAYKLGKTPNLPELEIQYCDFADWQRSWLSNGSVDSQLSYWKKYLEACPQTSLFPIDRMRTNSVSAKGAVYTMSTSLALHNKIELLSKKYQITLFPFLLTALQILIYRYTGQDDIVIGTPVNNRHYPQVEELIGFFVNTLAIRTLFDDHITFKEALLENNENILTCYENQDIPFEKVVEHLNIRRDTLQNPFYQVRFVLENKEDQMIEFDGLTVTPVIAEHHHAKFDLLISARETANGLEFRFEYATDIFDHSTIKNIARNFDTLLNNLVTSPEEKISQVSILRDDEIQKLLRFSQGNTEKFNYPSCFNQQFQLQALKYPDRTALIYREQKVSYQALNAQVNQMARYLIDHNIRRNELVAICLERSIEMIVALLAIIRVGAAYLPIDIGNPKHRLALILEDAKPSLLITHDAVQDKFDFYTGNQVLIESLKSKLPEYSSDEIKLHIEESDLIYVIYTSGTTGAPKGVKITHKNILNYIYAISKVVNFSDNSRVTTTSTLAADLGNTMIFTALGFGHTLSILPEEALLNSNLLSQYLETNQVNCIKITPTHFKSLLEANKKKSYLDQLSVIFGGEKLEWSLVEQLSNPQIFNHYGPTEATIGAAIYKVDKAQFSTTSSLNVPIGRPLTNVQIYIVDSYLQSVPAGGKGEIVIAGKGIAQGYLNNGTLTKEKFLSNPFTHNQLDHIYRTGDQGRYLSDGNIEFIGRVDNQVKIRGHRVECEEIQLLLKQHGDVNDVVITFKQTLIAYVIPGEFTPTAFELKKYLEGRLPSYMIPSYFVFVEFFPMTANGKLNFQALPEPDISAEHVNLKLDKPETEHEKKLAKIWKNLLKVSDVGKTDDFFQLGGHSLLAIKLIADIRNEFNLDISLRDLFRYCTIERLAVHLENKQDIITHIPIANRANRLPLSYAQQRLWFLDRIINIKAVYNIPVVLRLTGGLDTTALKEAYLKLILRHEILRTSIKEFNNQPYQKIYSQARENLREVKASRSEINQYIEKETKFAFDLENDSLIRGLLLKISDNEHVLIITMHHIVSDGWSMQIFFQELCHLYNIKFDNSIGQLPNLSIQYSDFAVWQRSWLDLVVDKQLSFWKNYLKDSPEISQFPTDKIRLKEKSYIGSVYNITISNELLEKLQSLTKKHDVTLFMGLITALQALLYRYTAQEDVIIGTPVNNRHYQQVENLIGFFVNTLALRFTFDDQVTFTQAILRNKENILSCYENQDVPFEQIVDELKVSRDLLQHPIYQIRFVLNNHKEDPVCLHGVNSEFLISERETAKFDLMISAQVTSKGLDIRFEYATDLFTCSTIQNIATCFEALLSNMICKSNVAISQLSLMSSKQAKLVRTFNHTAYIPVQSNCFNQKFYSQVKQFPNHTALTLGEQKLSYQELSNLVNQMANYLIEKEVTTNQIVAICLERSIEMIVIMLAIIRVGAAYLPIDPKNPKSRLKYILEDAKPSLLVYHETLAQHFDFYKDQKLTFEYVRKQSKKFSKDTQTFKTKKSDLLYVIYTSGSTGVPKGVKITHQNILNYTQAIASAVEFHRYSRVATTSNLAADLGNTMIFTALACGKNLSIVPEEALLSSNLFSQFLHDQKIDCIKITPTHFKSLLESENTKSYIHQVEVIFGGEKLEWSLVNKLSNPKIFNHYGPTETTIGAAVYDLKQDQNNQSLSLTVPIGKPLINVEIYLLDSCLQPVPVGVKGEIFIGGKGVAQGYLNQKELTKKKFIINPFVHEKTELLYRTGDYARYLSDGNLEFLGRIDDQVKIRGYRVECGEIQSILKQHGDVKDAIVVAKSQNAVEYLFAYFIPGEFTPTIQELRNYLESRLPVYMVPTYFILVDTFPMMSNGKLNLQALPKVDETSLQLSKHQILPSTKIESELADIWKNLLNLKEISIYDNFFQIGGDSIISIQFVSKARKIGYSFSPKEIFLHPTINELGKIIEQQVEQEDFSNVKSSESIDSYYYPLSPMQKGMLFHSLYQSNSRSYVVSNLFTLNEGINEIRLKNSWLKVINQFEVLRTSFVWEDSKQPMQQVKKEIELPWNICNWIENDEVEQKDLLKQLIENERNKGFDLSHAPVYRFHYIILGQNKCHLLWTRHHILCDGWSSAMILTQVANEYFNLSSERTNDIKDRTKYHQYIDWIEQQDISKAKMFWSQYLKGLSNDSRLSSNILNITNNIEKDYGYFISCLSESQTTDIIAFAKAHKITVNTVAQVAWSIVLHKILQQSDFVFGVVVSGRSIVLEGVEKIVGNLINTLPLRVKLSESETVESLISKLQSNMIELQEFSTCSLAQIQAVCKQKKKTALFDNIVVFENFPTSKHVFSKDGKEGLFSDARTFEKSEYFLTLTVAPGQKLYFKFGYEKNDINDQIIQMLSDTLCYVFKQMLKNPKQAITEFSILQNKQRQIFLEHWNNTDFSYADSEVPVHLLFQRQVTKTPKQVAVITNEKSYTYEELNKEVNRLSNHLIKENKFQSQVIAIYLERSIEAIISILAALKIGSHYVCIDIRDPKTRVKSILEDTRAPIVITNNFHSDNLPQGVAKIINLNAIRADLDNASVINPPNCDEIESPAYIIYTSGSTGKPKGVVIQHRSLTNYLCWAKEEYLDDMIRSIPLHSSLAFDMSITSLFVPLISGNHIQLIQDGPNIDVLHYIVKQIEHFHFIKLTPTHLRLLKDYLIEKKNILCQTKFIIGGESLPPDIVIELQALLPNAIFYNEYGPTEATVACSIFKIPELNATEKHISIGRPISNTRIFILDNQMVPVPIGVAGQIYIGGGGLAAGYLNHPKLTSNKFNHQIYDDNCNSSEKLYQTGDLGRYYPNGDIEYMGRIDDQVKIKGYRIECKEIEYNLKKHGDVKDAIVLPHKDDKNNQFLVAYIVANEFIPSSLELSSFLTKHLPDYMLPKFYEIVEEYPTTANGKLDINLLPLPGTQTRVKNHDIKEPKSELEKEMLNLWQNILGIDKIGVTENFFQLGGDSILCIQLMTLARKSGILFDIKDIFENPTIRALVKSAKWQAKISSKNNTKKRDILKKNFRLSPIQEWFFGRQLANQNHFNQAFLLNVNERLSALTLNQGIISLLNQHETLSIRFKKSNGQWTQHYTNNSANKEWIDHINLSKDSLKKQNSEILLVSQSKQAQLNIENGPLFSFTLFELGSRQQKLLVIIHHLLIDSVSWRILLEDLEAICKAKQSGENNLVLERTDLYMDWVKNLQLYTSTPKLKSEYHFWKKIMVSQEIKTLPIDHDLGGSSVDTTTTISGQLSVKKTHALLKDVPSVYNTKINEILLAALAMTITKWLGSNNMYISMEGHGRELINKEIDISRTIGWFTSIFPVLIQLDSSSDIGLSIQNTKLALRSIPENGFGYSIIKYLSEYGDEFKHAKQPEICFNYLGQWDSSVNKKSLFDFATEEYGNSNASENQNLYLLNINSLVKNGQFQIGWKYSTNHFTSTTIKKLADSYIRNLESIIDHCLYRKVNYMIPLNHAGSLNPFFCIHPIDGDIHWLHEFAKRLDNNRLFIAIENISLSYDLFDSIKKIETLAKLYISEIKRVQPKGPYYIGGWSFGAVVAFEMAKLLEAEGEIVENLILLDQYPVNPEVSLDVINKIEEDKDPDFKIQYQNSKKCFNKYIQNHLIKPEWGKNPTYKSISLDSYQYMKASTSAYFLNRNLLKEHITVGKVKCITSILSKRTHTKKLQISVNPWEPFCDHYEQYIIDGDHNSIFQEPFVDQLLDILSKKESINHA